jgi:hypothetical protein
VRWVNERAVGWIALLTVAMIVVLSAKPEFSNATRPPRGIASPVVALEVARDVNEVDAIVGDAPSIDREVMRMKQYLDFGFIACYTALYLALSVLLARSFEWGRAPAIAAAVCGVAAAVFDVIENLAILRVLNVKLSQTSQAMVDAIRRPSLIKWTLAFAALTLLSSFFLAQRRRVMRAIGAVNVLAAMLGFYGLYDNAFLVWSGIPMLVGLVGLAGVALRLPSRHA